MTKTEFLQEKISFHMKHPDRDDLDFYRQFVEQHRDQAIGWLYLGREWEQREEWEKALDAYRQASSSPPDTYADAAREAYHHLLRKHRRKRNTARLRRGAAALLLMLLGIFFPFAQTPETSAPAPATTDLPAQPPEATLLPDPQTHTELIAVPDTLPLDILREQIKAYLKAKRPTTAPFDLIIVPEAYGVPLFTPLPFYHPKQIKGVLRYDPTSQAIQAQKWFFPACDCADDPVVRGAKAAFARERETLERTLILRNALYRTYQRKGRLPDSLAELASPHPANILPEVPRHPAVQTAGNPPPEQTWLYHPAAFQPERPWESMQQVLPLGPYPEPDNLGPLQMLVHLPSHTLTLASGAHPLRHYPIGLGRDQTTPVGYYTVTQKISHPRGLHNVYGTRGMIFHTREYAIHGTTDPASIGQNVSLGCIRLHNADVEELYSFVAPGTPVLISPKASPLVYWSNPPRYRLTAVRDETTPQTVYRWLH